MYRRKRSSKTSRKPVKRNSTFKSIKAAIVKKFRIFALSLVLVFGTFIVLGAVYAFQYFRANLTQASTGTSLNTGSLDTSHDFNILFFEIESFKDPTSAVVAAAVANFKPRDSKLTIIKLDPRDSVANVFSSGEIPVSALFGLSNLSSTNWPSRFSMDRVLTFQLGVPIDGVVYTDTPELGRITKNAGLDSNLLTSGHNVIRDGLTFSKVAVMLGTSIKTNLDLKSILALGKYLITSFPKTTEEVAIKDISENLAKSDLILKNKLSCQEILEERQTIIILNGTKSVGLAGTMGRLASNLGLSLLGSFNTPVSQLYKNSILFTKTPNSYTTTRLADVFDIDDIRSSDSLANDTKFNRLLRADLVLVAGSDQLEPL
jgi:hypothetical protein